MPFGHNGSIRVKTEILNLPTTVSKDQNSKKLQLLSLCHYNNEIMSMCLDRKAHDTVCLNANEKFYNLVSSVGCKNNIVLCFKLCAVASKSLNFHVGDRPVLLFYFCGEQISGEVHLTSMVRTWCVVINIVKQSKFGYLWATELLGYG